MAKLKFKNKETGQYEEVSLIQGPKGEPGEVIQQSYIGPEKPEDENISVWIDTDGNPDGDLSVIPTKVSQLQNDAGYTTSTEVDGKIDTSKTTIVEEINNSVDQKLETKAPIYSYGTEDLQAGTSPLETGKLYFVYE